MDLSEHAKLVAALLLVARQQNSCCVVSTAPLSHTHESLTCSPSSPRCPAKVSHTLHCNNTEEDVQQGVYLQAPGLPHWSTAAEPSPSGARPKICAAYSLLLPRGRGVKPRVTVITLTSYTVVAKMAKMAILATTLVIPRDQ